MITNHTVLDYHCKTCGYTYKYCAGYKKCDIGNIQIVVGAVDGHLCPKCSINLTIESINCELVPETKFETT